MKIRHAKYNDPDSKKQEGLNKHAFEAVCHPKEMTGPQIISDMSEKKKQYYDIPILTGRSPDVKLFSDWRKTATLCLIRDITERQ